MPDIVILFFLLGLLASLVRSDLRLPRAAYDVLAIYLLLAIGLKGGLELSRQPLTHLWDEIAACLALGFAIPVVLVPVLRWLGFGKLDSASLAGHYGSVSVVTFAVALAYLQRMQVGHEAHAALWVALMEAPALIAAIAIARIGARRGEPALPSAGVHPGMAGTAGTVGISGMAGTAGIEASWKKLAHDVLLGKPVLLLAGGLVIGAVAGEKGMASVSPVFIDAFKGLLALFLLELGRVAGQRLGEVRQYGWRLVAFGVMAPLLLAGAGGAVGRLLDLSTGGVALMATLAASASYIAAPTAMRIALPQANAALSITAALGITFPFNVLVGIPLYLKLAQWLTG